jgi:predicted nucleotidyltransferase
MRYGLPEETISLINTVFSQHPLIEKVVLYGSRAKGTYKPGSDVDLTIIGSKMTLKDLLCIENQLDDLLLPYTIDLSLFHQIHHPDLIEHIQRVGCPFYSTEACEIR